MMRTDEARRQILREIRESLVISAPHDALTPPPEPARRAPPAPSPKPPDVRALFTERLEAVGAQWTVVRGEAEAAGAVARILTGVGARCVVGSDAPLVRRLLPAMGGGDAFALKSIDGLSRDELFACDAGVTTAQWGIAETGTLVLESACEQNRLLSLVPPVHIALLPAGRICDSLGEALERVRHADAGTDLASRAITLITGPSRTSDIELTLTIGVHGPQAVHVVILEGSFEDRSVP
jgi:L-lactate dehydrogenase complex protein LldG